MFGGPDARLGWVVLQFPLDAADQIAKSLTRQREKILSSKSQVEPESTTPPVPAKNSNASGRSADREAGRAHAASGSTGVCSMLGVFLRPRYIGRPLPLMLSRPVSESQLERLLVPVTWMSAPVSSAPSFLESPNSLHDRAVVLRPVISRKAVVTAMKRTIALMRQQIGQFTGNVNGHITGCTAICLR